MPSLRQARAADLGADELAAVRELCAAAWAEMPEPFSDDDWRHALGGVHFLVEEGGEILAHGSVVPRTLHTNGVDLATGYVEAVATWPERRRRGHGTTVMRAATTYVDRTFALGALCTGVPAFYQRLGWTLWEGPTSVRGEEGERRTPGEDGTVLVRLTPASPDLDVHAPISCDWRPGDAW